MRTTAFIRPFILRAAAALALFFSSGCEQVLDESELHFTEMLVIRGVLKDGDVVDSLYVGRTLPYEEQLSSYWDEIQQKYVTPESAGNVKDAVVSITVGGVRYPLTHIVRGLYGNDTLVTHSGSTYHLDVTWNGKRAVAVTTIPSAPVLDSASVLTTERIVSPYTQSLEISCTGYCRSAANTVLMLTAMAFDSIKYFNGKDSIVGISGFSLGRKALKRTLPFSGASDRITVSSSTFFSPEDSTSVHRRTTLRQWIQIRLTVFDEPYYRYYLTAIRGVEEGTYAFDRAPIAWNVTGDGIGMFIGTSPSIIRNFFR